MDGAVTDHRNLWFLDTRVTIRLSHQDAADGVSILEHWAAHGDSPPLHIHASEDEIFYIVEGEVRFRVDERNHLAGAGETLLAPQGVAHTYRVESAEGARWLTITRGRLFEDFVRAFGRPAEREGLPDRSGPPTSEQAEALASACRAYGIELVGPPLS